MFTLIYAEEEKGSFNHMPGKDELADKIRDLKLNFSDCYLEIMLDKDSKITWNAEWFPEVLQDLQNGKIVVNKKQTFGQDGRTASDCAESVDIFLSTSMTKEDVLFGARSVLCIACQKRNNPVVDIIFSMYEVGEKALFKGRAENVFYHLCKNDYFGSEQIYKAVLTPFPKVPMIKLLSLDNQARSGLLYLCQGNVPNLETILEEYEFHFIQLTHYDRSNKSSFWWMCKNQFSGIQKVIERVRMPRFEFLKKCDRGTTPLQLLCTGNSEAVPYIFARYDFREVIKKDPQARKQLVINNNSTVDRLDLSIQEIRSILK